MTTQCVGVSVKGEVEVRGFLTKPVKGGTLIGVTFQGAFPFDAIKNTLIDQGVNSSFIKGNYMFTCQL